MTVDEIRNALMKYRPGELAGKTDAEFSHAVQYAVSILANEKREEYKYFIKAAEQCDIKNCKDCPLRNDGMCGEVAMEKLAAGLEKELEEVKCAENRIRELEAQHRTEMCEAGYDCVQIGKERKEAERERKRSGEQEENLKRALAAMWFAYQNKDAEMPHDFEFEAVEKARELLGEWSECMTKYLRESGAED